jgi:predicted transcriptional regulator
MMKTRELTAAEEAIMKIAWQRYCEASAKLIGEPLLKNESGNDIRIR